MSEIKLHNREDDCWTVFNGKVYDVTEYLQYHPGGVRKLMLGAGQDCTELFNKYHRWVNIDGFLGKMCVGIVGDDDSSVIVEEEDSVEKEDEESGKDDALKALNSEDNI
jgi:cytochrome b involved in lipid metabolism